MRGYRRFRFEDQVRVVRGDPERNGNGEAPVVLLDRAKSGDTLRCSASGVIPTNQSMDMNLKKKLVEQKSAILKKWFNAVADTYPDNTAGFLKKPKKPSSRIPSAIPLQKDWMVCTTISASGHDPGHGLDLSRPALVRIRRSRSLRRSEACCIHLSSQEDRTAGNWK